MNHLKWGLAAGIFVGVLTTVFFNQDFGRDCFWFGLAMIQIVNMKYRRKQE
jgi:uncharacterized membrane protein YoaK (UPF0700 family)